MKRAILFLSMAVLLSILLLGAWLLVAQPFDEMAQWPREKFDSVSWQATPEEGRYIMVKDLMETKVLDGLSRQHVVALLGSPSSERPEWLKYVLKLGSDAITMNQVFFLDVTIDKSTNLVVQYSVRGD